MVNIERVLLIDSPSIDQAVLRDACRYGISYLFKGSFERNAMSEFCHLIEFKRQVNLKKCEKNILNMFLKASYLGVPDKFRPLVWRLFLGYLPRDRQLWTATLAAQRACYQTLV